MAETYEQMQKRHQKAFDAIMEGPDVFFAFSKEQLESGIEKFVAAGHDRDDLCKGPWGMFGSREAFDALVDATRRKRNELQENMLDHDFFISAIVCEMGNHEYHINNWQGNWDVCNCFHVGNGDLEYDRNDDPDAYFDQLGWNGDQRRWYGEARSEFYRLCDENDWW